MSPTCPEGNYLLAATCDLLKENLCCDLADQPKPLETYLPTGQADLRHCPTLHRQGQFVSLFQRASMQHVTLANLCWC